MNKLDVKKNILIGCTGSVATIKIPILTKYFQDAGFDVKIVTTTNAKHFLQLSEEGQLSSNVSILSDEMEWAMWQQRGDPVLHIDLTKWADVMVIAPLDANTLAKMAQGVCDNLLLCIVRAWIRSKPLYFCPAMNTQMWTHPITAEHVDKLKSWNYKEIPCIEKRLMCGDTGLGAMANPEDIFSEIFYYFKKENVQ